MHTHAHTLTKTCTHIYTNHTCIHTYIHTYIHAHWHTYTNTYVRTYTQTYTDRDAASIYVHVRYDGHRTQHRNRPGQDSGSNHFPWSEDITAEVVTGFAKEMTRRYAPAMMASHFERSPTVTVTGTVTDH
jgi:hypothetical protein